MAVMASAAVSAGLASVRAGELCAVASNVTSISCAKASYPARMTLSRQARSHWSVDRWGTPAIFRRLRDLGRPADVVKSPCGGIGRRARLKIEFRKECWFDSGQGHQLGCSSPFQSVRNRPRSARKPLKNRLFRVHRYSSPFVLVRSQPSDLLVFLLVSCWYRENKRSRRLSLFRAKGVEQMARKNDGACANPKQIRTDVDCRAARPKFDKGAWSPAKLSDVTGGSLYLFVPPDES